jgi:hypothetical protein
LNTQESLPPALVHLSGQSGENLLNSDVQSVQLDGTNSVNGEVHVAGESISSMVVMQTAQSITGEVSQQPGEVHVAGESSDSLAVADLNANLPISEEAKAAEDAVEEVNAGANATEASESSSGNAYYLRPQ